jgi:hypothetical protein
MSSISSISCAAVAAPPLKNVFTTCQEALTEILAHKILTSQSIICCTDVYNYQTKDIPALYASHGERIFALSDFGSKLIAFRELSRAKMLELGLSCNPYAWALFAKTFKIGACDELSMALATSSKVSELCIYRLVLLGQVKLNGSRDHHVLLAFSNKPIEARPLKETIASLDHEFLPSFQTLKDVVIVDAYHHRVLRTENLLEDAEYAKKLKAMGNTKFLRMESLEGLHDAYPLAAERLGALAHYFEEIKTVDITEHPHFYDTKQLRINVIKEKLEVFCHMPIKFQSKTSTFWMIKDEAFIRERKAELESRGLTVKSAKVKDKEDFCLMISFDNYAMLCKIQELLA